MSEQRPIKSLHWFIVVGRAYGDDEACAVALQGEQASEAEMQFKTMLRGSDEYYDDADPNRDAPGTVWIDAIFDCGTNEPRRV